MTENNSEIVIFASGEAGSDAAPLISSSVEFLAGDVAAIVDRHKQLAEHEPDPQLVAVIREVLDGLFTSAHCDLSSEMVAELVASAIELSSLRESAASLRVTGAGR